MLTSARTTLAVNGIIALIFGVLALFLPKETVMVVAKYFGLVLLIGGIVNLVIIFTNKKDASSQSGGIIQAVAGIVLGIIIFLYTKESLAIFVVVIGIWALIFGVVQILIATRLSKGNKIRDMLIFNGILTTVFGVLLFFNPFKSAVILTFVAGVLALIIGIAMIYFAIRLKELT